MLKGQGPPGSWVRTHPEGGMPTHWMAVPAGALKLLQICGLTVGGFGAMGVAFGFALAFGLAFGFGLGLALAFGFGFVFAFAFLFAMFVLLLILQRACAARPLPRRCVFFRLGR